MVSFDAFISYSTRDKTTADAVCATLEASGVRCWIAPRDITPGADWTASIIDALDHCRVVVLIFSASANTSADVRNEVAHAVQRGVPVLPVRIEDIVPTQSLAYFMTRVHWLDALTPPLEQHLQRLAETIKALLPGTEAPTGRPKAALGAPYRPGFTGRLWKGVHRLGLRTFAVRALAVFGCVILAAAASLLYVRASNTERCDRMWGERNSYYNLRGLCFRTPRAIERFDNSDCTTNDVLKIYNEVLSPLERDRVRQIRFWEWLSGCSI